MKIKRGIRQLEAAATMFDALSDTARLMTLMRLADRELSVSELAAAEGEKMTTVSARLQILHAARLIARRREGKKVIYSLADEHVVTLVENAIAHAGESH
jgi:DNA-binding transcriptional ArsR family regulator